MLFEAKFDVVDDRELFERIREVLKTLGPPESAKGFPYAAVLLAAANVGAIPHRLAEVTGYSLNFIEMIDNRMRAAGIWVGHRADTSDWEHPENGIYEFLLHTTVAEGIVGVKAGSMPRRYFVTPLADLLTKATSSYN